MDNKFQLEQEKCRHLRNKGLSRQDIAEHMGLTLRQVKSRLEGSRSKPGMPGVVGLDASTMSVKISAGAIEQKKLSDFFAEDEDDGEEFFAPVEKDNSLFAYEEVDMKRDRVKNYIEGKYGGSYLKILVLNDLHIPFTDYKALSSAISEHDDADLVVVNGDMLDLFAVSKFAKDKQVALKREVKEGREFLEYVTKKFEDVVITEGNHERRLARFIQDSIPEDMQFLFPQDILQMIVDGEVLKKDKIQNAHVVGSWWVKLFDTIFAHPDNYSSANLKTVQNTSEYFSLIENVWHRQCIIGHTHRAGSLINGEVNLMEAGCICHNMDYHKGAKFVRTKWTKAHGVIYVDKEGLSDFNRSRVILL